MSVRARASTLAVVAVSLALGAGTALAQELLSRPEIPGYQTPTTQYPSPRAQQYEYLHTAALAVALVLATYLALGNRSRKALLVLTAASLAWFGFWRQGCVCPIGAIQNVARGLADPSFALPWTVVVFFALPLVFALLFGRTFCAAVCPLGAVQELAAVRPVKVPAWLDHALGLVPFAYLGVAVVYAATGTAFVICEYDPFVGFFRLSFSSANMLVVGLSFLVVGIFIGRPYCRYLCPYGALLGLCSRVSRWHVRIPPEECINCRLCEDACPYGAIRQPTVPQPPAERLRGRRRLAAMLILLPIVVASGALLGRGLATPLAHLHPRVQLAERMQRETRTQDMGQPMEPVDATTAFRNTGRPVEELYAEALGLRGQFGTFGLWLGAWMGLVIGAKLISLSIRRRRTDYQPDRANCVACGRCFWYCPVEQVRLGLIETLPAVQPEAPASGHVGSAGD